MPTQDDVMQVLARIQEPDLGGDLVSLDLVRGVAVGPAAQGERVAVHVALTTPASPHQHALRQQIEAGLRALPGVTEVELRLQADPPGTTSAANAKLPKVRHVLGVGAGKGGVGKSTVAVNLAVALAQAGAQVGLLDADVYGPSVPIMLGLRGSKPAVNAQRKIVPAQAHGIKAISMGFMVQEDMAVAWRGPMVGRAVTQFVEDVDWGELDYLVVDLPPGTGDIILSLCQAIPLSGAVVVSTPQDVAFADVLRAVRMFSMLKVDVVGLVENMSYFRCPDNGKDYEIFGPSNSKANCEGHAIPFLGKLALDMLVSPNADAGRPIVAAEPTSHQAEQYRAIAGQVASHLVRQAWQDKQASAVGEGFFGVRPPA